jgi:hypothetical protein
MKSPLALSLLPGLLLAPAQVMLLALVLLLALASP